MGLLIICKKAMRLSEKRRRMVGSAMISSKASSMMTRMELGVGRGREGEEEEGGRGGRLSESAVDFYSLPLSTTTTTYSPQ